MEKYRVSLRGEHETTFQIIAENNLESIKEQAFKAYINSYQRDGSVATAPTTLVIHYNNVKTKVKGILLNKKNPTAEITLDQYDAASLLMALNQEVLF
ncbi:MAG: hypothetical protein ACKOW9_06625 [Candidatus Paceibacterota bacterium]